MHQVLLRTPLVLALAASLLLSGCARTLIGYYPDHPSVKESESHEGVKAWAYDVSDGYSSRGSMNRNAIYVGAGLAAAGAGALGGLGATGYAGHGSVIIPLAATFLGSVFGYYQSDEKALLYFMASDAVKYVIDESDKRVTQIPDGSYSAKEAIKANIEKNRSDAEHEITAQKEAKAAMPDKLPKDATPPKLINEEGQKLITALAHSIDDADKKIAAASSRKARAETQAKNLEQLTALHEKKFRDRTEALCLRTDVDSIMGKVQHHIAELDPKNVSAALKKVKAGSSDGKEPETGSSDSEKKPEDKTFDLSDLKPENIVSVCDIGI